MVEDKAKIAIHRRPRTSHFQSHPEPLAKVDQLGSLLCHGGEIYSYNQGDGWIWWSIKTTRLPGITIIVIYRRIIMLNQGSIRTSAIPVSSNSLSLIEHEHARRPWPHEKMLKSRSMGQCRPKVCLSHVCMSTQHHFWAIPLLQLTTTPVSWHH